MAVGTRMQQRRATAAVWTTSDYVLAAGELGVTTDTGILKIGDGSNTWSELPIAFESLYLPLLGTATNSELFDGLSSETFVRDFDAVTTVTNDSVARRTATGTLKAATAAASDDLTTKAQIDIALLDNKQIAVQRTVTGAATLALTDLNDMVFVNHSSLTAQVVITVPTNVTVAFPIGAWIDVIAIGAGGAKITPSGGVTVSGATNVFPGYGCVRLHKTGTDTWIGISQNAGKRLPKIRIYKNAGGTSYTGGAYTFIPYDTVDGSVDFYNPDNEWFSVPGAGLATARRILVNKDGEYLVTVNFISTASTNTSIRVAQMISDNTLTGGRVLAVQPCFGISNLAIRVRLSAGIGIGAGHFAPSTNTDIADGNFDNRNDLIITRLSD